MVDEAQAEPITIEKNGRPVAVIYSYREAQKIEELKLADLDEIWLYIAQTSYPQYAAAVNDQVKLL